LDKIRTLDVHLHFSFADDAGTGATTSEQRRLEQRVQTLEQLLGTFKVVGSSLESDREAWRPEQECAKASCPEPPVHLPKGMSVDQFAISFVHQKLLGKSSGSPLVAVGAAAAAREGSSSASVGTGQGGAAAELVKMPPPERRPSVADIVARATSEDCRPSTHSASSRPGVPCLPPLEDGQDPWKTSTDWRIELGERAVAAVSAEALTEKDCGRFELFGDSTWCMNAMNGKDVLGLSYGIEERDMWSEKMSNVFHMPTQLYDCFQNPDHSPPMAGTAPNGTQKCDSHPGHCYETWYKPYRICLGPENTKIQGRKYENVVEHLKGHRPLSLHLKVDSEGTEWAMLKQLLDRPEELDKIRTFEMEVHFSYVPEGDDPEARLMSDQDRLEKRVRIMERMLDKFVCTGTNLEVYAESWKPAKECRNSRCDEPAVHLYMGMSVDQFAVSYVHRDLM